MDTLKKRYDLPEVGGPGERVSATIELDKGVKHVKGIFVTADREDHLYHRGQIGIQISGREVVPDDHHARLYMTGLSVEPGKRFLEVCEAAGNGVVKLSFTDRDSPAQPFQSPYIVSVYLEMRADV